MLSVHGIYENGIIRLLQQIPHTKQVRVIVTVIDDFPSDLSSNPANGVTLPVVSASETSASETNGQPGSNWLGALRHTLRQPNDKNWIGSFSETAQIIGDIVSPLEETWQDWEVLRE